MLGLVSSCACHCLRERMQSLCSQGKNTAKLCKVFHTIISWFMNSVMISKGILSVSVSFRAGGKGSEYQCRFLGQARHRTRTALTHRGMHAIGLQLGSLAAELLACAHFAMPSCSQVRRVAVVGRVRGLGDSLGDSFCPWPPTITHSLWRLTRATHPAPWPAAARLASARPRPRMGRLLPHLRIGTHCARLRGAVLCPSRHRLCGGVWVRARCDPSLRRGGTLCIRHQHRAR